MNTIKTLALVAVAASGLVATGASAQVATNSVSTTAKVKILRPITVTEDSALNFGTVIVDKASTVSFPVTAAAPNCGTNVCVANSGAALGQFGVSGTKNESFSVTLPATVSMANPDSATPLLLTLASNLPTTGRPALDANGAYVLKVGGSFPVTAAQAGGQYSGTYNVSVSYN